MTTPTDGFIVLHQRSLKIHINLSYYRINMNQLVVDSAQLILSLKNTDSNEHLAKDTRIANLGGNGLVNLIRTLLINLALPKLT